MAEQTFKEAYGVLQHHAETLREQQEPNIDDLLSIVTESVSAYQVCKQRIDAVEKALEKALSDTAVPSVTPKSTGRVVAPAAQPVASPFDADDIPF